MQSIKQLKADVGRFLWRIGVSANFVTGLGLVLAAAAGLCLYLGDFFAGAYLLLLSGILDLADGAVARASSTDNKFGAILDSTLDRYGDGLVLAGLLFYSARTGRMFYALLAFSALMGSFATSYVRARAECLTDGCRIGFWERGERIVFICVGLFLKNPAMVLWVLAIATHWTAIQRLAFSATRFYPAGRKISNSFMVLATRRSGRTKPVYFVKCLLLATLLLYKPVF